MRNAEREIPVDSEVAAPIHSWDSITPPEKSDPISRKTDNPLEMKHVSISCSSDTTDQYPTKTLLSFSNDLQPFSTFQPLMNVHTSIQKVHAKHRPDKGYSGLFILFFVLGIIAIVAFLLLGILSLGFHLPGEAAMFFGLAVLILIALILSVRLHNTSVPYYSEEAMKKREKRQNFWKIFGAIMGSLVVIFASLLLLKGAE